MEMQMQMQREQQPSSPILQLQMEMEMQREMQMSSPRSQMQREMRLSSPRSQMKMQREMLSRGQPGRTRISPRLVQNMVDDRTLDKLCHSDPGRLYPAASNDMSSSGTYPARLFAAATKFRRLAASFDCVPDGLDLDRRTAVLLSPRNYL